MSIQTILSEAAKRGSTAVLEDISGTYIFFGTYDAAEKFELWVSKHGMGTFYRRHGKTVVVW